MLKWTSMINGETRVTKNLRTALEDRGAFCVKLSDRFTRGVPDLLVITSRVVMVELKVLTTDLNLITYSALGLSGAQDRHIRFMVRRVPRSACVITGELRDDSVSTMKLWLPVNPSLETDDAKYRLAASSEAVIEWLT